MQNIFDTKDVQQYIDRINLLTPDAQQKWGKMNAEQFLARRSIILCFE
jgi:hypothetical protein